MEKLLLYNIHLIDGVSKKLRVMLVRFYLMFSCLFRYLHLLLKKKCEDLSNILCPLSPSQQNGKFNKLLLPSTIICIARHRARTQKQGGDKCLSIKLTSAKIIVFFNVIRPRKLKRIYQFIFESLGSTLRPASSPFRSVSPVINN